jgi:hypothetical protein
MKMQSQFSIGRVGNGWFVQMPRPLPEDGTSYGQSMMAELKPFLKEIVDIQHRDPLLASLQQEPEPGPQQQQKQEVIGRDDQVYVFPKFSDVLIFLAARFLD